MAQTIFKKNQFDDRLSPKELWIFYNLSRCEQPFHHKFLKKLLNFGRFFAFIPVERLLPDFWRHGKLAHGNPFRTTWVKKRIAQKLFILQPWSFITIFYRFVKQTTPETSFFKNKLHDPIVKFQDEFNLTNDFRGEFNWNIDLTNDPCANFIWRKSSVIFLSCKFLPTSLGGTVSNRGEKKFKFSVHFPVTVLNVTTIYDWSCLFPLR